MDNPQLKSIMKASKYLRAKRQQRQERAMNRDMVISFAIGLAVLLYCLLIA